MAATQKRIRGSDYPHRPGKLYVLRYMDMLDHIEAVNQVGFDGMRLLWLVVKMEDRRRYQSAPTFFNSQLMTMMKGVSETTLQRIRQRCVAAGLLHYEAGGRGVPGLYWVTEPDRIGNDLWKSDANPFTAEGITGGEPTGQPVENRGENRPPSFPVPETLPTPAPVSAAADDSESDSHEATGRDPRQPGHVDSGTVAKAGSVRESLDQLDSRLTPTAFLVDALHQRGVHTAKGTVARAMDAGGMSPEQVADVIDYFDSRPDAWRAGALVKRLTLGTAARLAPSDGWPPPDEKEKKRQQQEHAAQFKAMEQERQERERAKNRERMKQLELQFGDQADRMTDEEWLAVLHGPPQVLFRRSRDRERYRSTVISALATAAGVDTSLN